MSTPAHTALRAVASATDVSAGGRPHPPVGRSPEDPGPARGGMDYLAGARNGGAAANNVVPSRSLFDGHPANGGNRAAAAPLRMTEQRPGISWDARKRVFRLRGKDSLYVFRVDDSKNLEHLYWGPPLLVEDDLTYLSKTNVPAPFDPKGVVSVARKMGLDELGEIADEHDLSERWKVYTRAKDTATENDSRPRRLENASWRLWSMERHRGGDLNKDLSDGVLAMALGEPVEGDATVATPTVGADADGADGEEAASSAGAADGSLVDGAARTVPSTGGPPSEVDEAVAPALPRSATVGTPAAETSSGRPSPPFSPRMGPRSTAGFPARIGQTPTFGPTSPAALGGTTAGLSSLTNQAGSSMGLMSLAGASADLTPHLSSYEATNWSKLDPELVGKNTKLLEFADHGTGDYREPSLKVRYKDGSTVSPLEYKSHRIVRGKPTLDEFSPGVYVEFPNEATTLIVEMVDPVMNLVVLVHYTVMHEYDAIIRRNVVVNSSSDLVTLLHVASVTLDYDADQYYMTQLSGGWARERQVVVRKLDDGLTVVKSSRGASSHQFNPFIVISPGGPPAEDSGIVTAFTLVYSGNFMASAEISESRRLRVSMGLNPEGFTWSLSPGEKFNSPEVIMSYSDEGMGKLSRGLHRLMRQRLVPPRWRNYSCPVLLNTWEAAYFNVTHEVVVEIGRVAAKAGIEMIVLDDGWFGERNDTTAGLGDWFPNRAKLPYSLDGLVRDVNNLGLKFGLWMEPEMVSMDSKLYKDHPDWCLHVPSRGRTTGRNQLVLDFSRECVRDHIYNEMDGILSGCNIEYVKWDMNRHLTEVFSQDFPAERQGEVAHRFLMGVYEVLGRITRQHPDVLFETCSGGGGRFDAGMLFFSPQIWTSDNTDALSRVQIQMGTSLAYPVSSMGSHVSSVPNHQTLRTTSMKTRSLVALCGTFGYELDPRNLTTEELAEIRRYIELHKKLSPIVIQGDMYRMWSPFTSDSAAWMFVSQDKNDAVAIAVNLRREVGRLLPRLTLRGLAPNKVYQVEELCPGHVVRNIDTGAIDFDSSGVYQFGTPLRMSGRALCSAGLPVKFLFDADSVIYSIKAIAG